jgi:hypothetical protein
MVGATATFSVAFDNGPRDLPASSEANRPSIAPSAAGASTNRGQH